MPNTQAQLATSWWELDETSGVRAWAWHTPNHGTYMNTPTLGGANGVTMNGTNEYVNVPHDASLDLGSGSGSDPANDRWGLWAQVKRGTIGAARGIMSKGTGGPYLRLDATGKPQVLLGGGAVILTAPTALDTQQHAVMATRAGADVRLYVDGAQVASTATANTPTSQNTSALRIGAGPTTDYWNGTIYAAAVYNGEPSGIYPQLLLAAGVMAANGSMLLPVPALASTWRDPADVSNVSAQLPAWLTHGRASATGATYLAWTSQLATTPANQGSATLTGGRATLAVPVAAANNGLAKLLSISAPELAGVSLADVVPTVEWAIARLAPNIALGDTVTNLGGTFAMVLPPPQYLTDQGAVFYRAMIGPGPTDYAPGSSWVTSAAAAAALLPARGAFLGVQVQLVRLAP